MKKIYIVGPMAGYAHSNFPAFSNATIHVMEWGYTPISPTEMVKLYEGWDNMPPPFFKPSYADRVRFMRRDLLALLDLDFLTDAIYMLKGWENSKGAKVEHALAEYLGLKIIYQ